MTRNCKCRSPVPGKVNCKSCGYPIDNRPTIEQLREERVKLLVTQNDPEKLKEIQSRLDYFDFGITQ